MCDSFTVIFHNTFNRGRSLRQRWCNLALLRLVRRGAEVKTTRLRFKTSSLAVCTSPRCLSKYIQLKIRFTKRTNELRLFPGSRHSGVKRKIKRSVVKWIEPNSAFKIINFHLSYPLYLFLFIIHFCVSLSYCFFYPRLLNVCTCVPCIQVATPLLPIHYKRTRRTCLSIRQTLIFRRAKLRQTPNISWTYSVQFGSSHEMFEAWPAWASVCLLLKKTLYLAFLG